MAVKIDKVSSEKIKVISIIASIMVVMIHSTNVNIGEFTNKSNISNTVLEIIEGYFTLGINRVAVPLFFMVSGYLFFKNIDKHYTLSDYFLKLKSRFFSILIPFIIWSTIGLLFYFLLQSIPGFGYTFNNDRLIREMNLYEVIYTIIFNPIPYQLWFVRELFIYVIISPVIWILIKYMKKISLLIFFIMWFFNINIHFIDKRGVLFFMLGSYMAIYSKKIFSRFNYKIEKIVLFIYLILPIFKLLSLDNVLLSNFLDNFIVICGLLSIGYIYDNLLVKIKEVALKFAYLSFLIFLMHEPILSCFRIVLTKISNNNTIFLLLSYFLSTVMTVVLICIIMGIIERKAKFLYKILSGGR